MPWSNSDCSIAGDSQCRGDLCGTHYSSVAHLKFRTLRPMVAPATKFVPVTVTDTVCRWTALAEGIEVSVGGPNRKTL